MKEIIIDYLLNEEKMTEKVAEGIYAKLSLHPDIMNELVTFITTGNFVAENPVSVCDYTAQSIKNATYLHPIGAFNYLIYLRNNPTEAIDKLKKGLPRR